MTANTTNKKHLVVLIHGLWGSHKHMKSMQQVWHEKFDHTDGTEKDKSQVEETIFFAPRQNALFKTFDGIEIIGYRTLIELCHFIKTFHTNNKDAKITKISVVGYSLGGLVARFVIGKCFTDCLEIFKDIHPFVFMTVASPHLGIQFYSNSFFSSYILNPIKNFLGSTLLGTSGRELFIMGGGSKEPILVRLSKGEYLYALSLFKHRIVMANVKNDRTVAFYTAFISDKDPFIETDNKIKYFFEQNIPEEDSYKAQILPRIVDLNKLDVNERAPTRKVTTSTRRYIIWTVILTIAFLIILPIALILNICGSIYSYAATVKYRKMIKQERRIPVYVQEKIGISNKVNEFVSDTYDSIMSKNTKQDPYVNANDQDLSPHTSRKMTSSRDTRDDSLDNSFENNSITTSSDTKMWDKLIYKYSHIMDLNEKWVQTFHSLPFDQNRQTILENLSKLEWIRLPIYVKFFNAHGAIIARSGVNEKTAQTGLAALEFSGMLTEHFLDTEHYTDIR